MDLKGIVSCFERNFYWLLKNRTNRSRSYKQQTWNWCHPHTHKVRIKPLYYLGVTLQSFFDVLEGRVRPEASRHVLHLVQQTIQRLTQLQKHNISHWRNPVHFFFVRVADTARYHLHSQLTNFSREINTESFLLKLHVWTPKTWKPNKGIGWSQYNYKIIISAIHAQKSTFDPSTESEVHKLWIWFVYT